MDSRACRSGRVRTCFPRGGGEVVLRKVRQSRAVNKWLKLERRVAEFGKATPMTIVAGVISLKRGTEGDVVSSL